MSPTDTASGSSDESFDRFAALVRTMLGVPTAMVTIVEANRQVFPGAVGLPEPWQTARETPLSHSLCQTVVDEAMPLLVADTRLDERTRWSAAITDLGAVAYAGWPLTDSAGAVVGSLCAIDQHPHEWTPHETDTLQALAEACSAELAQREQRRRADQAEAAARHATARANTLLALSAALAQTRTIADVAAAVTRLGQGALGGAEAVVWTRQENRDHAPSADARDAMSRDEPILRDRTGLRLPEDSDARYSIAHLPLHNARQVTGVLTLIWQPAGPHHIEGETAVLDRSVLRAVATYTGQALARAHVLEHRTGVAQTLQRAMLTALPEPDHLHLVAHYVTAAGDDQVGGDWYDALVDDHGATTVIIGDVAGHDINAAALMGQLRSMLRAFIWEHPNDPPSAALARLDAAMSQLRVATTATVFVGRIEQDNADGARGLRTLHWSSAGHPPPIVIDAHGDAAIITADGMYRGESLRAGASAQDVLLGVSRMSDRRDWQTSIEPGTTLLLYTDGLVETRAAPIDEGIAKLVTAASRHHRLAPDDLLRRLTDELVGEAPDDDVATLAVRFNREDRPRPREAGRRTARKRTPETSADVCGRLGPRRAIEPAIGRTCMRIATGRPTRPAAA